MPQHHIVKVWPMFFGALGSGEKPFEIRYNDRGYAAGDTITLQEWRPETGAYTGLELHATISYVMTGFGLAPGYVALGLQLHEDEAPLSMATG